MTFCKVTYDLNAHQAAYDQQDARDAEVARIADKMRSEIAVQLITGDIESDYLDVLISGQESLDHSVENDESFTLLRIIQLAAVSENPELKALATLFNNKMTEEMDKSIFNLADNSL
jgi:hypothetical protein